MIARVAPLTRLPKGLAAFDYLVPAELEQVLQQGHLVMVPFRSSTMLGVVLSFVEEASLTYSPSRLKQLISIVGGHPFLSTAHLTCATTIASWYGIALGGVIKMMAPPLQKRKLQSIHFRPFPAAHPQMATKRETGYTIYTDTQRHAQMLTDSVALEGQTLILLPELQYISVVFDLLSPDLQQQSVIWHSELSMKEQFERCLQIRNGEKKIIIGLRGSVFLPFHNLESVVVDYEHHEQHKHWDQVPRFHVVDIVDLLHTQHGAAIHLMSFSPGVSAVEEHSLFSSLSAPASLPTILDMRVERQVSHLALSLEEKIEETQGDIFLLLNRRGFSRHIECSDCGKIAACPQCQLPLIYHEVEHMLSCHYCNRREPVPLVCPRCQSTSIRQYGIGTQFIESSIKKLLAKNNTHTVYRIDSDATNKSWEEDDAPRIVIGTEMALQHIRWGKTQLIALLHIDQQLGLPEYLAEEHVWHVLHDIGFRKMPETEWYIQTMNPEREIFQELAHPKNFYERTLDMRKQLHYPPFCYLVKYFIGGQTAATAQGQAQELQRLLLSLTSDKETIRIGNPFEMHPRYFRGKFWYGILARLDHKTWQADLARMNTHIPAEWKIDPNPISILSP